MVVSSSVNEFFKKHKMHFEDIDFRAEMDKFKEEMKNGLAGKSSLMMLPTYIRLTEDIPLGKPVISVDAGGTNLRIAGVTLTEQGAQIESFNKYPMPGSKGTVTANEFYSLMADYLEPVLDYSDTVSFCFSFPSEIMPNQDGKVLYLTKEIYIEGIEGTLLGEEINKRLVARGYKAKKVIVLNDTVAAMLSAVSHPKAQGHVGNIGLILGTGLNLCYGEKCGNIAQIAHENLCNDQKMVINIEAGGYALFPRGTADQRLDALTKDPGNYLFEKMASGAYLGRLIFQTVKLAAAETLFSKEFASKLATLETFQLWDINELIENTGKITEISAIINGDSDKVVFMEILEMLYHRLARIVIVSVGAIMEQGEIGGNKEIPVAITAEGTTFYKSPILQKYLKQYEKEVLKGQFSLYSSFLNIEDATLIGTTVAGLTPEFSAEI